MKHRLTLVLFVLAIAACGATPRPSIGIKDFNGVQVDIIDQANPGDTILLEENEFGISYDYQNRTAFYLPIAPADKVQMGKTVVVYRYKTTPPDGFIENNINPTLVKENWSLEGGGSLCLPGDCG